jgi:hydroxymethylpyrimidine/phosphomethylpyrimidine kinase
MSAAYRTALTIAGSDPSGGAGIQADLKTFSALQCYGMAALTSLTAQNTQGVQDVRELPADFIGGQLQSLSADIAVHALKTGLLASPEAIGAVAAALQDCTAPAVVDPVMVAKSGDRLLTDAAIEALAAQLLPRATLVTPNRLEAELLLGRALDSPESVAKGARELLRWGPQAVLLKGGRSSGPESADCLAVGSGEPLWLSGERIQTANTHGSGCTLSAAVTAGLARGQSLEGAVRQAKTYMNGAIRAGAARSLGGGRGPVHHFYHWWDDPKEAP